MDLIAIIKKNADNFLDHYSHFHLIATEIEQLSKRYGRKIKVVDLGCGSAEYWKVGELRKVLENNVFELILIDTSDTFSKMKNTFGSNVTMHAGLIPEVL